MRRADLAVAERLPGLEAHSRTVRPVKRRKVAHRVYLSARDRHRMAVLKRYIRLAAGCSREPYREVESVLIPPRANAVIRLAALKYYGYIALVILVEEAEIRFPQRHYSSRKKYILTTIIRFLIGDYRANRIVILSYSVLKRPCHYYAKLLLGGGELHFAVIKDIQAVNARQARHYRHRPICSG